MDFAIYTSLVNIANSFLDNAQSNNLIAKKQGSIKTLVFWVV